MKPDNALVKVKDDSGGLAKPQLWPIQAFPEQKKDLQLKPVTEQQAVYV